MTRRAGSAGQASIVLIGALLVGLAFVGMPVCLHKVQIRPHTTDVVDKISNAA